MRTITLLWPDGKITSGRTWTEVEAAMRAEQPYAYRSRRAFRDEMRHRAEVWSGERLPKRYPQTARGFIHSLADLGLYMIVEEN
jgi:hypothetical protein